MAAVTETGELYSAPVAFIYIFNLIIGVGALTMPKAFAGAGWLISLVLLGVLAFISFITATFMVEAMAAANALLRLKARNKVEKQGIVNRKSIEDLGDTYSSTEDLNSEEDGEKEPLINRYSEIHPEKHLYEITTRVEMGQMAKLFYNTNGLRLFYFCICLYLYGDLAIYAAAVPKSLALVSCEASNSHSTQANHSHAVNITNSSTNSSNDDDCWGHISKTNVYRIYLLIFTLTLGPFAFFNVQKTKYLQMLTTVMRWLAFSMMIVLALIRIKQGKGKHHIPVGDFGGIPNLFGVCIYAFMCQHSLPSFITPMRSKSRVTLIFSLDFGIILLFYSLLSFSAIFAFEDIQDLYTLNFKSFGSFVHYFLALFPVFTLSTNFPIISVTLRDNLKNLFYREGRPYPWVVDKVVFPLVTVLPPIGVAFATQNLEVLVGVTGSYAGAGVQYVIPATLVYFGRKQLRKLTNSYDNKHRSAFRQRSWIFFVLIWAVICIAFVTANHIITKQ